MCHLHTLLNPPLLPPGLSPSLPHLLTHSRLDEAKGKLGLM